MTIEPYNFVLLHTFSCNNVPFFKYCMALQDGDYDKNILPTVYTEVLSVIKLSHQTEPM